MTFAFYRQHCHVSLKKQWTKTTLNGVDGVELVSRKNGNSIFLPATGCHWDIGIYYADDVYC